MTQRWRTTRNEQLPGLIRLVLSIVFVTAGLAKVLVAQLGAGFAEQLTEAGLPWPALWTRVVPPLEVVLGLLLLAGYHTRPVSLVVLILMGVATHVHLVVEDPALFPLQGQAPVVPLVLMAGAIVLLIRGGGSWSMDLGRTERTPG